MPYPMGFASTFRDFVQRLTEEFDCRLRTLPARLIGPGGVDYSISYLERQLPGTGEWVQCALVIEDEDEFILPNQLRKICSALHISTQEFGLHLG